MTKVLTTLVVSTLLAGCATPVKYTLYEDGTRHYDSDPRSAPTNKVEVGYFEAVHKPPLITRLTIVAGYTIGLPIAAGRDIGNLFTGKPPVAKEDVKMCLINGGCEYNPVKGSEKRIN